jgi:hypothetical protein
MNTVQWLNKCSCTAAKIKVQINSRPTEVQIVSHNTLQCYNTVQLDQNEGAEESKDKVD